MLNYIFGGRTGVSSPQELAQRRELARTIKARNLGKVPHDLWEGLNAIASAIGGRVEGARLEEAEVEGKASAQSAFAPITQALMNNSSPDKAALIGTLSNEWLNPGRRSIAEGLYKQLAANNPRNAVDRRRP